LGFLKIFIDKQNFGCKLENVRTLSFEYSTYSNGASVFFVLTAFALADRFKGNLTCIEGG
jgi:hypothetical protein